MPTFIEANAVMVLWHDAAQFSTPLCIEKEISGAPVISFGLAAVTDRCLIISPHTHLKPGFEKDSGPPMAIPFGMIEEITLLKAGRRIKHDTLPRWNFDEEER